MFTVLRYLSEETFFNRIVVKEEVVNSFFRKLREFSPNVFRLINKWAEIMLNPNSEEIKQIDSNRISKLKSSIVEAIFSWVLMEIKEEHFQIISQE